MMLVALFLLAGLYFSMLVQVLKSKILIGANLDSAVPDGYALVPPMTILNVSMSRALPRYHEHLLGD
jgi:hypothetical protein